MKFLKYTWLLIAIISSWSLFIDTMMAFSAISDGYKLHPQLVEHWPFNILSTCLAWYLFSTSQHSKQ